MPRGCSRLINISKRCGWVRHLPGGWPDRGSCCTGGKWTQRCAAPAYAPIPDLTCEREAWRGTSVMVDLRGRGERGELALKLEKNDD